VEIFIIRRITNLKTSRLFSITIKNKTLALNLLHHIKPFLRINKKRKIAELILESYHKVIPRNGKYSEEMQKKKLSLKNNFQTIKNGSTSNVGVK
jgi:hypothetical protein